MNVLRIRRFALGRVAALLALAVMAFLLPKAVAASKGKKGQPTAPVPSQLYPGERTPLPIHGWPGIIEPARCDAEGDIYIWGAANPQAVESAARQGLNGLAITRIKPDSGKLTEFAPASPQGYKGYFRPSFYVDPRGAVYALIIAYKHAEDYHAGPNPPHVLVVQYKDDGTIDSVTKLEPPPGPSLEAFGFAAFLDGSILLTGNLVSGTPGVSKMLVPTEPFTWVFNRSGVFEAPVKLADDVGPPDKNWMKEGRKGGEWMIDVQRGGMLGSLDGTVYLYRASDPVRLYAVSSGGSVFRRVTITPPRPGLWPIQTSLTENGQVLIEFGTTTPSKQLGASPLMLALADLETGDITGVYKIPPGAGMPTCADPQGGFLFLNLSKHGNLEVQTFVPQ